MPGRARNIYVEIDIRAPLDRIWRLTQMPDLHQRWDLRFSRIEYLPRPDPAQPQRFRYSTRIGLGLQIQGEGETVGCHAGPDGQRTSALAAVRPGQLRGWSLLAPGREGDAGVDEPLGTGPRALRNES